MLDEEHAAGKSFYKLGSTNGPNAMVAGLRPLGNCPCSYCSLTDETALTEAQIWTTYWDRGRGFARLYSTEPCYYALFILAYW